MRPKKITENEVKVSLRLPMDLLDKIDTVSESMNISRSETIRIILSSNLLFELGDTYANKKRG